jgi:hypothetical protein
MDNDSNNSQRPDEQRNQQDRETSQGKPGQSDQNSGGGMSGQPIGCNDSATGSGTTMSAGYTPPQGQSASGQAETSQAANAERGAEQAAETMDRADQSMSNSPDSAGAGQPSGDSAQGGFVGSQTQDSGGYVQQDGQDFAREGRGAQDEDEATRAQNRNSDVEGSSQSSGASGSDSKPQ